MTLEQIRKSLEKELALTNKESNAISHSDKPGDDIKRHRLAAQRNTILWVLEMIAGEDQ